MRSLWALLAAVLVSLASAETSEPEKHQVVIIGAGVAGIAAGVSLVENNVNDFVILEASDRIGGRIHSVEFGEITIDMGAEDVHGETGNVVYEIAKPFDALYSYDTDRLLDSYYFTNPAGDDYNHHDVLEVLIKADLEIDDIDDESQLVNTSYVDYFNSKFENFTRENNVDPKLAQAVRRSIKGEVLLENAIDDLSDLGYSTDYKELKGDQSLKWKQGTDGYIKLFEFMTKKFPKEEEELPVVNKTLFKKEVTEINYGAGDQVTVKCADGSTYLADHVIVTVSLGVLKKHADTMFQPALPERKTAAIKALGFGNEGKVYISFAERWWPKNVTTLIPLLSDEDVQEIKSTTKYGSWAVEYADAFLPGPGSDRMLVAWYTGQACRAMEALPESEVLEGMHELLQKTLGKKFDVPKPEKILRTSWSTNPYTLGSYDYHSVESVSKNIKNLDLADPILDKNSKPVVLFAGEATHPTFYSTTHGALETGRREAKNIIDYLHK